MNNFIAKRKMSLKTLSHVVKNLRRTSYERCKLRSESNYTQNNQPGDREKEKEPVLPPEPTHCCMSGCANCVWIKYAQEVTQLFEDGDMIAKKKISEKVQDPKLRAFLFTQLGLNETESKN